jgi:hypothetical protein
VVLVGSRHRLAGTDELAARELWGERIFVTSHRDGAGYDRAVASMLEELGVTAALVRGAPWPVLHAGVARGDTLALTTAPGVLPDGVHARRLQSSCTLSFQLLLRDESASPAVEQFIRVATECAATPKRPLLDLAIAA